MCAAANSVGDREPPPAQRNLLYPEVEMELPGKVIDPSAVLGVKVFYEDPAASDMQVEPISVVLEFNPGAYSGLHIHPEQDETFHVRSGTLDLFLNDRWQSLQSGESMVIPKGTIHGWRNSTAEVVRVLNTHDPGLRFLDYLEQMERLIRADKLTGMNGLRNGIYLSMLAAEYRREIILVRPPDWFIRLMARVGRILGYEL
jgi:quercetin dioxygenase-like cupin family protein